MSDDPQNRHEPDRSLINLNQDYELSYWTGKFGCTKEELREAVRRVGNSPEAVQRALQSKAASH